MSYSSNSGVSAWYSFTRSSKSGSICLRYCTTSVCSTFESISSESTLSENTSRMMPRVSDVSRCSSAGARTEPDLRLIFFHRPYRCSISRLQLCSVRSSATRSEEHTSELQSRLHLVCRLLLEKKKNEQLSPLIHSGTITQSYEDSRY